MHRGQPETTAHARFEPRSRSPSAKNVCVGTEYFVGSLTIADVIGQTVGTHRDLAESLARYLPAILVASIGGSIVVPCVLAY